MKAISPAHYAVIVCAAIYYARGLRRVSAVPESYCVKRRSVARAAWTGPNHQTTPRQSM